jgi:hypothetical protein
MDDSVELESLNLDQENGTRESDDACEASRRARRNVSLPPSVVERTQRCESSEREMLRKRARFELG